MKHKHITAVSLILIGLTMISFTAKDGVTLRLKPQQGKTYTISSKANMTMMIDMQGQSVNQSQAVETRQSFTVKDATSTTNVIETQIDAIKLNSSVMGMKLEYDSEHPEKTSPMLAGQTKDLEASLKKPSTITYDQLGHIVGDSIDLSSNQLSNVIIELPEKEVSVGSKWNSEKTQSVSGTDISVNMEYTVTAISKKSVDVSFTGDIKSTEITGSYNGTASINPQTGLMTTSTTKMNISMTITEQGLSMPVTMIGTTTVEVK